MESMTTTSTLIYLWQVYILWASSDPTYTMYTCLNSGNMYMWVCTEYIVYYNDMAAILDCTMVDMHIMIIKYFVLSQLGC